MPNGLEEFITPDSMADVIAYILENQVPPKSFAGNQPQVVKASDGKVFRLPATHAEIYGNTLIFEGRYKNLGFWGSENDQAIWTLDHSEQAGTYAVYLDWAAAQNIANNPYILQAGDQILQGRVGSTGTWDDYRQIKLGEIKLPTGTTRLSFKAQGQPRGFLIDLREICLVRTGHPPPAPYKQAKN